MSDAASHEVFKPIRHVAAKLGVPVAWLKAEAEAGRIPCLRAGRQILLHLDTVEQVLLDRAWSAPSIETASQEALAHAG